MIVSRYDFSDFLVASLFHSLLKGGKREHARWVPMVAPPLTEKISQEDSGVYRWHLMCGTRWVLNTSCWTSAVWLYCVDYKLYVVSLVLCSAADVIRCQYSTTLDVFERFVGAAVSSKKKDTLIEKLISLNSILHAMVEGMLVWLCANNCYYCHLTVQCLTFC